MKDEVMKYIKVIAGSFLFSLGIYLFVTPSGLNSGGVVGVAQILNLVLRPLNPNPENFDRIYELIVECTSLHFSSAFHLEIFLYPNLDQHFDPDGHVVFVAADSRSCDARYAQQLCFWGIDERCWSRPLSSEQFMCRRNRYFGGLFF